MKVTNLFPATVFIVTVIARCDAIPQASADTTINKCVQAATTCAGNTTRLISVRGNLDGVQTFVNILTSVFSTSEILTVFSGILNGLNLTATIVCDTAIKTTVTASPEFGDLTTAIAAINSCLSQTVPCIQGASEPLAVFVQVVVALLSGINNALKLLLMAASAALINAFIPNFCLELLKAIASISAAQA